MNTLNDGLICIVRDSTSSVDSYYQESKFKRICGAIYRERLSRKGFVKTTGAQIVERQEGSATLAQNAFLDSRKRNTISL